MGPTVQHFPLAGQSPQPAQYVYPSIIARSNVPSSMREANSVSPALEPQAARIVSGSRARASLNPCAATWRLLTTCSLLMLHSSKPLPMALVGFCPGPISPWDANVSTAAVIFFRVHWVPLQLGSALVKYGSFQHEAQSRVEMPRAASAVAFADDVIVGTKLTVPLAYNENDPFIRYGNAQPRSGSTRRGVFRYFPSIMYGKAQPRSGSTRRGVPLSLLYSSLSR